MEKMQEFLADKKERASKRSPKYGMRKLSIGFVSCFLGCMIFMAPGQIHAQVETSKEPVAIAMEEKVSKEAEAPKAEAVDEPAIVNPEEGPRTEVVEEKTQDAPTPVEANVEGEEAPKAEAVDTSDTVNLEEAPAAEENVAVLELAKLLDQEALTAGETTEETQREPKDISNDIINPRVSIRTENTTTPGTLDAGLGEQLTWGLSFTTPEGTKEGDTFTVKLSDNMSLKGLEPDTDYALPVKFGDKIIATAKRIDRQTIQYTFTKDIEEMKYARVYIINSAQENKDVVQNSGNQTFKINVGEKAKVERDINVDFGQIFHDKQNKNLNGRSQFTEFNPETGEFTQVFYLNPESKEINTSSTNDQNGREFGKVGFLLSSPHDADKPRSIDFKDDGNTKIEVKKLSKGAKLPDAIIENPEGAQKATNVKGEFRNFKGEPMFTMNFGGGNKIDSPYVVVVKGHANKIDGKYTNLYSNGTLYGDGEASLFLDNSYTVQENSTASEGEKETLGYFKEHHIYITKENGTEKSRFEIPGATVSGTADEYYYTDKNEIPGYHFVKVDTDKLVNNPAYDDQGKITQGHFKVGETKEVTYIYERDVKKGSFKETHVYKTLDFEGNVVEDKTITEPKDATSGTKDESYKSAKVDKDGYVFTKVTADKGSEEVKISDDKKSVIPGNYVEDKNLSVTYEYVKQPGRFVEHHIYKTVDKKGNVLSEDEEDVTEKDGKKIEGFSNESVNTGKKDKTGYTFKESTEIKLQNDDSEKTYTNYVPGKTLEKTYIYTKTKEEPQPEPVEQTYSLGDRVWIDDNKDGLQTEGEKGLKGVTVKLTGGDLKEEKTTTTDANGNYKFEGLKNGEYKVTFVKPEGYKITKTNEGTDDAKDSDGTEVAVTIKDADNMTVDLGLVKEEPATPINNPNPKEKEDPKPSEPSTPRTPDPRPNTNPGPKEPNYPIVEEPKDPSPVGEKEKDPAPKEESPVQKPVEEVKEVPNKPVEVEKKQVPPKASDDARAPQTFDPGVASYLGLAGLASALMAYMEDRKRKNK